MSGLSIELTEAQLLAIAEKVADLLAEREPPAPSELLTVHEVADLLRCDRKRVYRMASDGRLAKVKDGSRLLIERAEVERHLASESEAPARWSGSIP